MKLCNKCNTYKVYEEYTKHTNSRGAVVYAHVCKPCKAENQRAYYAKTRKAQLEKKKEYHIKNALKIQEYRKKFKEQNKEHVKQQQKSYRKKRLAKILISNSQYRNKKRKEDPLFKFKLNVRANVYRYFRKKGFEKITKTEKIIGAPFNKVWEHIQKTWETNYGFTWNGQEYHIDHIIPLAIAKTKEDVIRLSHYTNLQMLTPKDNLSKNNKTGDL